MGFKAEYAYPKAFYLLRRQREFVTPRWEKFKKRCEYIAYRYDVPFTVVDENHPIYQKTPEELEEEAHRRAIEAAERMRQSLGTRAYNQKMKEAAMALPSKFPHLYKSLWDEIEANVEIQVQAKLKGKKR
jgi:hypothetical protein